MANNQRTIRQERAIRGKSLHTGEEVSLTLKPALPDSGFLFRRTDLYGKPEIRPTCENISDLVRSTTITNGNAKVHTIEHVLSALVGCGIDNAEIELDASEPPIMDGSSRPFVNLIMEAEPVEQEAERKFIEITEPVSVTSGNRSIIALPYDGFRVTCTSADDRGIHVQHLSIDLDAESYVAQIAPARTFTIYEEIEELLKMGKIQGGSLDSAIVIKGDKVLSKEPLRFDDEFVRHKILDIVGDFSLLGKRLKAHIIAVRPGHSLNSELVAKIIETSAGKKGKTSVGSAPRKSIVLPEETELDVRRVLDVLPHRFPFVLIDRVVAIDGDKSLTALKNVSVNEPFFPGHFPGHPVMPGVLQLEAMAQAAGILLLRKSSSEGKVAFFMSADKVKFRKPVVPGDQLIIVANLDKIRGNKIATAKVECKVGDQVVSSASLMFSIVDATE
ncbi:bifunctional UDP-3-O-[3-hydroxymyristoyl] N-acetylglucosamine deacetylase/3-hydroxyacyl-ACP dehydratase [bacterium]|jgi:UDP-3-O-[3-hydroxymyristoyl] N-acetylglucosamine deacetylase/3-hydroxyacyl-[acyl-carrier-protein] dehydratase|uniref:bifunctional UDP-3-O-[3-hydroxymyristoyl] N-acetylglucosamine deacetylase/3-hydroxyacyl-ACP dehydratase n=1 Tax=Candidatus Chordibacter forsetii TaxID=3381758 RepID=UPI002327862C|nr:bifunctional UDP-3-O-[3-hydroxymyristoyl] N-acetylglucosamine deacetylase/3-hydroxyacyl-ACP dehydratase [bacterium]MDA9118706.1 bifunctional UDP-3-O-[3-hydroxymyristoyl] N-acetylglucosamine deacetylase/3-hydroxyacyl-ACP dehydratase [Opitutales bacterium]MDB3958004.1 bifunctional UDP-3-O-[3-hydroxymyristoyl] N-acetylglucosamine deacetylase/3-hydroxyacyl-ACP dehydratase [Opitutales bacterium]